MCIKRVYIAVDRISYSFILLFQLQKSFSFFLRFLVAIGYRRSQMQQCLSVSKAPLSFFLTYTCPRLSWDKGATVRLGKVHKLKLESSAAISKSPNPCMRNEFLVEKSFLFHKFSSWVTQLKKKKMGKHASDNNAIDKKFYKNSRTLGNRLG